MDKYASRLSRQFQFLFIFAYFEMAEVTQSIGLQLSSTQESDLDCPPGFELVKVESKTDVQSFVVPSSSMEVPYEWSESHNEYDNLKCIVEGVMDELYMSAKFSFAKYVEEVLEKELRNTVKFSEDKELVEVTVRFCSSSQSYFFSFNLISVWS